MSLTTDSRCSENELTWNSLGLEMPLNSHVDEKKTSAKVREESKTRKPRIKQGQYIQSLLEGPSTIKVTNRFKDDEKRK